MESLSVTLLCTQKPPATQAEAVGRALSARLFIFFILFHAAQPAASSQRSPG